MNLLEECLSWGICFTRDAYLALFEESLSTRILYIFEWNLKKWTEINEITLYGELYMQIFEITRLQTMRIKK